MPPCESEIVRIAQDMCCLVLDRLSSGNAYNQHGIEWEDYIEVPHHSYQMVKECMLRICSLTGFGRHYSRALVGNFIHLITEFISLTADSEHGVRFEPDNLDTQIDKTQDLVAYGLMHLYKLRQLKDGYAKEKELQEAMKGE